MTRTQTPVANETAEIAPNAVGMYILESVNRPPWLPCHEWIIDPFRALDIYQIL